MKDGDFEMNIENARKQFIKYTNNYDKNIPSLARKIAHSIRVMDISKKIAENIELDKEQIDLATMIGLLHDIGRFEQIKRYRTLKDHISIDHADLGVEILSKNNFIRTFIEEQDYDEIIFKAIKNHNKYKIEEGLTKEELLYAKIIRDADKIDILYEGTEIFWKTKEEKEQIENSEITEEVIEDFENEKLVDKKKINTPLDSVIGNIAFIFDLNYDYSIKMIRNEKYVDKTIDRFEFKNKKSKEKMDEIREVANDFMEEN